MNILSRILPGKIERVIVKSQNEYTVIHINKLYRKIKIRRKNKKLKHFIEKNAKIIGKTLILSAEYNDDLSIIKNISNQGNNYLKLAVSGFQISSIFPNNINGPAIICCNLKSNGSNDILFKTIFKGYYINNKYLYEVHQRAIDVPNFEKTYYFKNKKITKNEALLNFNRERAKYIIKNEKNHIKEKNANKY